MARVDPRIVEEIAKARLQGRGPNAVAPHNPDWPPYQMYPEIYDAMDDGDTQIRLQEGPDELPHDLDSIDPDDEPDFAGRQLAGRRGESYAQYQGQPQAPDIPSARDTRNFDRGSPEMRKRFEDYFGTEAVNRADQGVSPTDKSYIPTPRARPGEAPVAAQDDYLGELPLQMPSMETGGPLPEDVYGYMPGLKDRVMEQLAGEGPSRDLKRDRLDGDRWDRAMAPFSDQPTGNIQDYRMMAIENMLKRGADTNPPDGPEFAEPLLPPQEMSIDDMIQRQLQEWRAEQGNR